MWKCRLAMLHAGKRSCTMAEPDKPVASPHGTAHIAEAANRFHPLALQVAGASSPPHFRFHIQPGSPANPRNQHSQTISRAGEGKGLQVFFRSVPEVT